MLFSINEKVKIRPNEYTPILFHNFEAIVKMVHPKFKEYTVDVCGTSIKIDEDSLEKIE
jgi:hypothetical protein